MNIKFAQHNMASYSKYLLQKGYPILDTQNLHIKTNPLNLKRCQSMYKSLTSSTSPTSPTSPTSATPPICPIPPTGPSALIAIMIVTIVYDIFHYT